jgi:hypothetical protein
MEQNRERYRKLPGRRRGFIFGSSVWMGSDHLLLVKSQRFREEYKRFYFRDIQAIVTAKAPRFHISTRAVLIAALWCAAYGPLAVGLAAVGRLGLATAGRLGWFFWVVAAALPIAWVYVSAFRSCRCRIYTAVSSEELPSLYRTWTARRFLAKVEPAVAQAQGAIEGNWAEAVDDKQIGPPAEGRIGLMMPGAAAPLAPPPPPAQTARNPVSFFFVASLCLGGLADLVTLRASVNAGHWILMGFLLLQIAAAVAVVVQTYQGLLRPAMRNLAITFLASVGIWYYAVQMAAGFAISYQNATSHDPKVTQVELAPLALIGYPVSRGIAGGIALVLGLAGVALLLRRERPAEEKVSFNV